MIADFYDFNKIVDEKIENSLKFCVQSIDVLLNGEEGISEYIKSGKLYFNIKKYRFLRNDCQNYVIRERLHEIYLKKGWNITFRFFNPCDLPFLNAKVIGIIFSKSHESLVE